MGFWGWALLYAAFMGMLFAGTAAVFIGVLLLAKRHFGRRYGAYLGHDSGSPQHGSRAGQWNQPQ